MSAGQIVQIIGAVVDVEFARDNVPNVYDALIVDEQKLTLEVQQQLRRRYRKNHCHGCFGWFTAWSKSF